MTWESYGSPYSTAILKIFFLNSTFQIIWKRYNENDVAHIFGEFSNLFYIVSNSEENLDIGRYFITIDDTFLINILDNGIVEEVFLRSSKILKKKYET